MHWTPACGILTTMGETSHTGLHPNIRRIYAIQMCTGAIIAIPTITLFFMENGLSMQQIFLLQGVFSLSQAFFELPTGHLADQWGRRQTVILGCAFAFLAFVFYALSGGFWGILLAELLLGFGASCLSGTLEALTYDTLLTTEQTGLYRRIVGHQFFLHFSSEAACSVLGGFLALISLRAPLWATVVPFGIAVLIGLTLEEPERHKEQETEHLKSLMRRSAQMLKKPTIRGIVLVQAVISTMTLMLFWFTQPYQSLIALPLEFFGIVHAIMVIMGAIASKLTHRVEKLMDDRLFLIGIASVVTVCYVSLGFIVHPAGLLLFLVARVSWGFLTPLTSDIVNRLAPSEMRATALSLRAFTGRLLFVAASPVFGAIADTVSISTALLSAGVAGGCALILLFLMMRPVWSRIPA
ncbi:MAG: MFS transporter [Candidatus Peregrinibacteria bacterium]|nr:MFS transporter [Candidatus Peregrinibacteria bacterium]